MSFDSCPFGKTYLAAGWEEGERYFLSSDISVASTSPYSIDPTGYITMSNNGNSNYLIFHNNNDSTSQFSLDNGDTIECKINLVENVGFPGKATFKFGGIEAGYDIASGFNKLFVRTNGGSYVYGTKAFTNGQVLRTTISVTKGTGDTAEITIFGETTADGNDTVTTSGDMGTDRKIQVDRDTGYVPTLYVVSLYVVGNDLESACVGGKYAVVIPRKPLVNYSVDIVMQWKTNILANGAISVYDYGIANDQYTCNYTYVRETTEADELATLAEETHRGGSVNIDTLHGETASAFLPFGPHISNSNPSVKIIGYDNKGSINPFGVIHQFGLSIVPAETITFDTQGAICTGGGFRFGSLSDTELPAMEYRSEYKVNANRYGSNTDLNWNPSTAQHKYCKLTWVCSKQNASNILIEVLSTIRQLTFTMNAGDNHYPFGVDEGQGDFTVRISEPIVRVESISADTWKVEIEVIKC